MPGHNQVTKCFARQWLHVTPHFPDRDPRLSAQDGAGGTTLHAVSCCGARRPHCPLPTSFCSCLPDLEDVFLQGKGSPPLCDICKFILPMLVNTIVFSSSFLFLFKQSFVSEDADPSSGTPSNMWYLHVTAVLPPLSLGSGCSQDPAACCDHQHLSAEDSLLLSGVLGYGICSESDQRSWSLVSVPIPKEREFMCWLKTYGGTELSAIKQPPPTYPEPTPGSREE